MSLRKSKTDVLILGSGGAGLFAAIHAYDNNPTLDITVCSKGLIGKSGCTRMVQGGYNAVLTEQDSVESHFKDTIEGGQWINDQELAWTLVTQAPARIFELENQYGCFFDRDHRGQLARKAFAGQTHKRSVHKGDLTGIEIINRLTEQVRRRPIRLLEEHRAVELIPSQDHEQIAAVLLIDIRSGELCLIQAKAVIIATGGGPSMYKYHTPSVDKSCDGLALALRLGLNLRDMEMVQFHPTGLLIDDESRISGTIIEEGLRTAGGQLLNGEGKRFMFDYDNRGEQATRDIVSQAMYEQVQSGVASPKGGVYISMNHLDPDWVRRKFKGMVKRCADFGLDLVSDWVEVIPTAHYMMGGIQINSQCQTSMLGLFAAGEDAGGTHGANRLGGNGVADSTVFGGIAGDCVAKWVAELDEFVVPNDEIVENGIQRVLKPFNRKPDNLHRIRTTLFETMWNYAGVLRTDRDLKTANNILENLESEISEIGIYADSREYNLSWQHYLNLQSKITVSRAIVAAALERKDSLGAHYRTDYPDSTEFVDSHYSVIYEKNNELHTESRRVEFTRIHPNTGLL